MTMQKKWVALFLVVLICLPVAGMAASLVPWFECYHGIAPNFCVSIPNEWVAEDSTPDENTPTLGILTDDGHYIIVVQIKKGVTSFFSYFQQEGITLFSGKEALISKLEETFTINGLPALRVKIFGQGYHLVWVNDMGDLYFIMYPDGDEEYMDAVATLCESLLLFEYNTPAVTRAEDYLWEETADGVTITQYIGEDARISIPSTLDGKPVTALGPQSFYEKPITWVEVPQGVTTIGDSAFSGSNNLSQIILPDGLTTIQSGAFESCANLLAVDMPTSLKTIGDAVFWGGLSLNYISLPASLETIGTSSFVMCPQLATIDLDSNSKHFKMESGMLLSYDGKRLIECPANQQFSAPIYVPDGVEVIDAFAMDYCQFQELYLPASTKEIGLAAFLSNYELEKVHIPASVKSIGVFSNVVDQPPAGQGQLASFTYIVVGTPGSPAEAYAEQFKLEFQAEDGLGGVAP